MCYDSEIAGKQLLRESQTISWQVGGKSLCSSGWYLAWWVDKQCAVHMNCYHTVRGIVTLRYWWEVLLPYRYLVTMGVRVQYFQSIFFYQIRHHRCFDFMKLIIIEKFARIGIINSTFYLCGKSCYHKVGLKGTDELAKQNFPIMENITMGSA